MSKTIVSILSVIVFFSTLPAAWPQDDGTVTLRMAFAKIDWFAKHGQTEKAYSVYQNLLNQGHTSDELLESAMNMNIISPAQLAKFYETLYRPASSPSNGLTNVSFENACITFSIVAVIVLGSYTKFLGQWREQRELRPPCVGNDDKAAMAGSAD
jgi:pentatricopeptide repeat protein